MSFSEASFGGKKRVLLHCNSLSNARKIWELGKKLGVSYEGDENEILGKFVELESRDRAAFASGGDKAGLK